MRPPRERRVPPVQTDPRQRCRVANPGGPGRSATTSPPCRRRAALPRLLGLNRRSPATAGESRRGTRISCSTRVAGKHGSRAFVLPSGVVAKRRETRMRLMTTRLVVILALLGASGCAAIQQSEAIDAERSLAAAGFQMRFADTPQRLAKASSLPQRKLVPMRAEDGSLRFVYADATFCK